VVAERVAKLSFRIASDFNRVGHDLLFHRRDLLGIEFH